MQPSSIMINDKLRIHNIIKIIYFIIDTYMKDKSGEIVHANFSHIQLHPSVRARIAIFNGKGVDKIVNVRISDQSCEG